VQGELRPILLRRMKEDVETLPEKEEVGACHGWAAVPAQLPQAPRPARLVLLRQLKPHARSLTFQVIIWVELTPEQRAYYKAIYENQIGTVRPGPDA
jgi:hypothetical protein